MWTARGFRPVLPDGSNVCKPGAMFVPHNSPGLHTNPPPAHTTPGNCAERVSFSTTSMNIEGIEEVHLPPCFGNDRLAAYLTTTKAADASQDYPQSEEPLAKLAIAVELLAERAERGRVPILSGVKIGLHTKPKRTGR